MRKTISRKTTAILVAEEANALLRAARSMEKPALMRLRQRHPKFANGRTPGTPALLSDAQLVISKEYGFPNWLALLKALQENRSE